MKETVWCGYFDEYACLITYFIKKFSVFLGVVLSVRWAFSIWNVDVFFVSGVWGGRLCCFELNYFFYLLCFGEWYMCVVSVVSSTATSKLLVWWAWCETVSQLSVPQRLWFAGSARTMTTTFDAHVETGSRASDVILSARVTLTWSVYTNI